MYLLHFFILLWSSPFVTTYVSMPVKIRSWAKLLTGSTCKLLEISSTVSNVTKESSFSASINEKISYQIQHYNLHHWGIKKIIGMLLKIMSLFHSIISFKFCIFKIQIFQTHLLVILLVPIILVCFSVLPWRLIVKIVYPPIRPLKMWLTSLNYLLSCQLK